MVFLGVPRRRNFVVHPAAKDHPSVLHMVSRRSLTCNFLWMFCIYELENCDPFEVSSHFCPQNQNNTKTMSQITCQRKDRQLGRTIKHTSKRNRHRDVVLLHRELYLNLNRHIRHGRALASDIHRTWEWCTQKTSRLKTKGGMSWEALVF